MKMSNSHGVATFRLRQMFLILALSTILLPLTAFAAPATPNLSDPIELQNEADLLLKPNAIGFFPHPINEGSVNFTSNVVKHDDWETLVDDLSAAVATQPGTSCAENLNGWLAYVDKGLIVPFVQLADAWSQQAQKPGFCETFFTSRMAEIKKTAEQNDCMDTYGQIESIANSGKADICSDPATMIDKIESYFQDVFDSVNVLPNDNNCKKIVENPLFGPHIWKYAVSEMFCSDTFQEQIDKEKQEAGNAEELKKIEAAEKEFQEMKSHSWSHLLFADIRDEGEELINSAMNIEPYQTGYPIAGGDATASLSVERNGVLYGIAVANYQFQNKQIFSGEDMAGLLGMIGESYPILLSIKPNISFYNVGEKDGKGVLRYAGRNLSWLQKAFVVEGDKLKLGNKCAPVKEGNKFVSKTCKDDNQSVAMTGPDLNGDGISDIVLVNRGEGEPFVTIYLGKEPASKYPTFVDLFDYDSSIGIGKEPYSAAVIKGTKENAFVTTADGIYKIGYENGAPAAQNIAVDVPAEGYRPYQITAVDLGGECQGFAFTSAQISAGEPGKPETASIVFTNKFTVYRGEKGDSGKCDKHTLVGHYSASQAVAGEGDAINNPALLAAITFAPADEEKGLSAGLWLGDQNIYTNADGDKMAYAYFYPIEGAVDSINAVKYRVSKEMDYLEESLPGGGVKQLRVDAYGNLGVVLGYPKVWQDIPEIIIPPPEKVNCSVGTKKGTEVPSAPYNWTDVDDNNDKEPDWCQCWRQGDKDIDNVGDVVDTGTNEANGKVRCDNCPGTLPQVQCTGPKGVPEWSCDPLKNKCCNPMQTDICKPANPPLQIYIPTVEIPKKNIPHFDMCADKGTEIKGVSYSGNKCYTNDLDCDGVADTGAIKGIICDDCPPIIEKNMICSGANWGAGKMCDPNNPQGTCVSWVTTGEWGQGGFTIKPCVFTFNPEQEGCPPPMGPPPGGSGECIMYNKCGTDYKGDLIVTTDKVKYEKCGLNDADCDGQADWYFDSCYKKILRACDTCPPPPTLSPYNGKTYPDDSNYECTAPAVPIVGCPVDQPCCNPDSEPICKKVKSPCGNTDTDGDGIGNDCDNCPFVYNTTQTDSDPDDGIGDECEIKGKDGYWMSDTDGDKVPNDKDNCPFVANANAWDNQIDSDNDGIGDKCDTCDSISIEDVDECNKWGPKCANNAKLTGVDSDGDGIDDACDDNSLLMNYGGGYWTEWQKKITELKNKGIAEDAPADFDGDGLVLPNDQCECFYSTDPLATNNVTMDKLPVSEMQQSTWKKFTGDDKISLPQYDYWSSSNPKVDKDTCVNKCTSEFKNCISGFYVDGSPFTCDDECLEACKQTGWGCTICKDNCNNCEKCIKACDNLDVQKRTYLCGDPDGDAICSQRLAASSKVAFGPDKSPDLDNCPFASNPSQTDSDNDGKGDACEYLGDSDIDGDTIPDGNDNCPFVANKNQADGDTDGVGNVCDTYTDPTKGIGSKTCSQYGVYTETCWNLCPSINGNTNKYSSFKLSGVDSDGDKVDDRCDKFNLPQKHFYWAPWKLYLQEKGFDTSKMDTSSIKKYDLNLISEAYAVEDDIKKAFPSAGAVTVLINKSSPCECLPSGTKDDYAKFTPECVEQLGGDKKPADGIPDTCGTGLSDVGECFVDIGRNGKQAAGIGELNSSYDTYVRDLNDKVHEMFCKAAQSKDPQANCANLRTDFWIGELGYYHITCAVGRDTPPPTGTTPGWALYQLGGIPLDPKYFAKDNYRPSFPWKTEVQVSGQTVTLTSDDLLKYSTTRLLGALDTPANIEKGIVQSSAALDFTPPSIVTEKKNQLVMPDKNVVAQNVKLGNLDSIWANIGADKNDPLMKVTVTPVPESGDVSQLSISPYLSSQFQPGQVIQVDMEGIAGVAAASFVHPDLAMPPMKLDLNIVMDTLAETLNQMVQDPNVTKIEYSNVMKALNDNLAAKGAGWDSATGYFHTCYLPTMGAAQPEVCLNIVPLFSLPASGAGGCGRCSLNGHETLGSGNVVVIILIGLAIFAPIAARRRRVM